MEDLKTVRAALEEKLNVLVSREKRPRHATAVRARLRAAGCRELENAEVLRKIDHQIAEEIELLRKAIGRMDSGALRHVHEMRKGYFQRAAEGIATNTDMRQIAPDGLRRFLFFLFF